MASYCTLLFLSWPFKVIIIHNCRGISWPITDLLLKKDFPSCSRYVSKFAVLLSDWTASCSCNVTASLLHNTVFKSQLSPCILLLAAVAICGHLDRWQRTSQYFALINCFRCGAYCYCGVNADSHTFMLRLLLFKCYRYSLFLMITLHTLVRGTNVWTAWCVCTHSILATIKFMFLTNYGTWGTRGPKWAWCSSSKGALPLLDYFPKLCTSTAYTSHTACIRPVPLQLLQKFLLLF